MKRGNGNYSPSNTMSDQQSRFDSNNTNSSGDDIGDDSEQTFQRTVNETRQIRNESLNTTREAVAIIHSTENAAAATLSLLGTQSEKLFHAQRQLDVAKLNAEVADEQTGELKRLNTFFGFKNPFRSSRKEKQLEEARIKASILSRGSNIEDSRRAEYESQRRIDRAVNGSHANSSPFTYKRTPDMHESAAVTQEIMDEEDVGAEAEIDSNLDQILNGVSRLKMQAQALNEEVNAQSSVISAMGNKSDEMNVRLGITYNKLKKFAY